jgi:Kelch motif
VTSAVRIVLATAFVLAGVAAAIVLPDGGDGSDGARTAGPRSWKALPSSPAERTEVGAVRLGRHIYVVGGFIPPNLQTTDQVARYDIATGSWSNVAPLPIAVNHPAVAAGTGRCAGSLYVYGGYTANGALSDEIDALQRFDPRTGSWTRLPGSGVARGAATLASVGCSLYAIGGVSGGAAQTLVQVYDIRSGSWRPGPGMKVAREHLASVAIRGRVLVLGGRSGGNLDAVEELDTRSRKWRSRPPIPTPRSGFGAAVVRGWAVVAGGEELTPGGETIRPVQAYNPRKRHWRKLPGMLTPRHGLGVVARGSRIFTLEGGPQPGGTYSSVIEMLRVPKGLLPAAGRFPQK